MTKTIRRQPVADTEPIRDEARRVSAPTHSKKPANIFLSLDCASRIPPVLEQFSLYGVASRETTKAESREDKGREIHP